MNMEFEDWFMILQDLGHTYGVRIYDQEAWKEDYDAGRGPEESFFDEYPEYVGQEP